MRLREEYNIKLIQNGNKVEFERLYSEFFHVLYSLSFQYTSEQTIAEGIVQDTFTKLWEVRARLKPDTNIRNFLYTLAKNQCLNYLRSQKLVWKHADQLRSYELEYTINSLSQLSDSYIEFEELQSKIDEAIEKLPYDLKQVFQMSRMEDLKYREIAQKLSISEKTVEARMSKALKFLRVELQEYLTIFLMFL